MLEPKRTKFRKSFRGKMRGKSTRGSVIAFGEYGLKAQDRGWLSAAQIEAGRKAITHELKRKGRVWVRVFPDKPVTSRPAGQRMGGGKGEVDHWVAVVTPGKILFEVGGVNQTAALTAFRKGGAKLPFKTKAIIKDIEDEGN